MIESKCRDCNGLEVVHRWNFVRGNVSPKCSKCGGILDPVVVKRRLKEFVDKGRKKGRG